MSRISFRIDAGNHGVIESVFEATNHAMERMARRGVTPSAVAMAFYYGRHVHVRNAGVYVIGRKEVARAREDGLNLDRYEGLQVICSDTGEVITTYKCRRFKEIMRT